MDSVYSGGESIGQTGPIMGGLMDSSDNSLKNINIEPLSSGYMVRVGCQTVAIETTEKLIEVLTKYLNDPKTVEKAWYSKATRNRLENIP